MSSGNSSIVDSSHWLLTSSLLSHRRVVQLPMCPSKKSSSNQYGFAFHAELLSMMLQRNFQPFAYLRQETLNDGGNQVSNLLRKWIPTHSASQKITHPTCRLPIRDTDASSASGTTKPKKQSFPHLTETPLELSTSLTKSNSQLHAVHARTFEVYQTEHCKNAQRISRAQCLRQRSLGSWLIPCTNSEERCTHKGEPNTNRSFMSLTICKHLRCAVSSDKFQPLRMSFTICKHFRCAVSSNIHETKQQSQFTQCPG